MVADRVSCRCRRNVRHCSVNVEQDEAQQLRSDSEVQLAFSGDAHDALECNDREDWATVLEPIESGERCGVSRGKRCKPGGRMVDFSSG